MTAVSCSTNHTHPSFAVFIFIYTCTMIIVVKIKSPVMSIRKQIQHLSLAGPERGSSQDLAEGGCVLLVSPKTSLYLCSRAACVQSVYPRGAFERPLCHFHHRCARSDVPENLSVKFCLSELPRASA